MSADQVGFDADHDTQISDTARVVQLTSRGVEVSEIVDMGRPGGSTTFKFAHFRDPDGNAWVLQEIPS